MATKQSYRGRFAAFSGLVGAFLLLGATLPASADEQSCPRIAAPVSFHAHNGWHALHLAAAREVKILAIGSSSTAGLGASSEKNTYPAQLQAVLAKRLGGIKVEVENAGISGETADATEARLEGAVEKGGYDLVVWQVGTNDAVQGVDPEAFGKLLQKGIGAAKRHAARMMLLDQQFYPGISDRARYETFVKLVESTGLASDVPVFSRYDMMKAWAGSSPKLIEAMLYNDQFHMSDRGYSCLAEGLGENILAALSPGLVGQQSPQGEAKFATGPAVATGDIVLMP